MDSDNGEVHLYHTHSKALSLEMMASMPLDESTRNTSAGNAAVMITGRPSTAAVFGYLSRKSPPSSGFNQPWLNWLRGKRTRQSEFPSEKMSLMRKNSPPPAIDTQNQVRENMLTSAKPVLERAHDSETLLGMSTAPVSSCSASTLSRVASWSDSASRTSPRESPVIFHPAWLAEQEPKQPAGEESEQLTVEASFQFGAKPIDIPYSKDEEVNTVAHEVRVRRVVCTRSALYPGALVFPTICLCGSFIVFFLPVPLLGFFTLVSGVSSLFSR